MLGTSLPFMTVWWGQLLPRQDVTATVMWHVFFSPWPPVYCSESSEEESAGEREEETGVHNKVTCSVETSEVPVESNSNTQTGECRVELIPSPLLHINNRAVIVKLDGEARLSHLFL